MKNNEKKFIVLLILFISLYVNSEENLKETIDASYVQVFDVSGNFTNSGFKEVLFGYQDRTSVDGNINFSKGIDVIICCIYDNKGIIVSCYNIPLYFSLPFGKNRNFENTPLIKYGTPIIFGNYTYGYVANINNNDKDEIYLYSLTGSSFYPAFFEFDANEEKFKKILSYDGAGTTLLLKNIDMENSELLFQGYAVGENQEEQEKIKYTWSNKEHEYVITSREVF